MSTEKAIFRRSVEAAASVITVASVGLGPGEQIAAAAEPQQIIQEMDDKGCWMKDGNPIEVTMRKDQLHRLVGNNSEEAQLVQRALVVVARERGLPRGPLLVESAVAFQEPGVSSEMVTNLAVAAFADTEYHAVTNRASMRFDGSDEVDAKVRLEHVRRRENCYVAAPLSVQG